MNYKMMGQFIAKMLAIEAVFMVPALLISLFCGETGAAFGFLGAIAAIAAAIGLLYLTCRGSKREFREKEGLVSVAMGWIVLSLMGCLPFYLSGEIPRYIDAFFEIVSGFTTTGASILPEVESLSRGILYWRSFSHWLGGMGVLVFLLAIAPQGGNDGFTMHLLRAESPGPSVGKLVPRMKKTAAILYLIYIVLTIVNVVFLLAGGMPLFDAVCTALGTAGTGGFGINFGCYYLLLLKEFTAVFRGRSAHHAAVELCSGRVRGGG